MTAQLTASIGQYSHRGLKQSNQDSHGACVPNEPDLSTKGIVVAIADGISSSAVSHIASQVSIKSFIEDYYCTSDTWSVKNAAKTVLRANNSWLFAQNERNHEYRLNRDKGYVSTFSALVFKSNTAFMFHIGDAQISQTSAIEEPNTDAVRAEGRKVETIGPERKFKILTEQHRVNISSDKSYLARALGISHKLEIDYREVPIQVGDIFLLSTDGVYEYVSDQQALTIIDSNTGDLNVAAQKIVEFALAQGSNDNLTAQVVRIDSLPSGKPNEFLQRLNELPFPPALQARMDFDGYHVIRDLHKSSRSHVVLAQDIESKKKVVIKLPSTEGRQDANYVERFLMEEWIANRLNNAHILKAHKPNRKRHYCYVVTEYIEGQSLSQWMADNPSPSLEQVRKIIEQIAIGLRAFHRQEMLHQDIRPNNIMIDSVGTVKIIDFGSTFVSGIDETQTSTISETMLGTAQFIAPEYFLGERGTKQSDLYSLACMAYHMLSGRSPYGTAVAKALTRASQHSLVYQSVLDPHKQIPAWVDQCLKKALSADPRKRYTELSEFIQDLRKPNPKFINHSQQPLLERDPVRFWQGVSTILSAVIIYLLFK